MNVPERFIEIAKECISHSNQERKEVRWLKEKYSNFCRENGIERKDMADRILYEKMYAAAPEKSSDTLKIRYWRTGRHVPGNREQCERFGKALDLSGEERRYLMTAWFDRSDRVFSEEDREEAEYKKRREVLDELIQEYFWKVHPADREKFFVHTKMPEQNFRHMYYVDAQKYIMHGPDICQADLTRHYQSVNYSSELLRSIRLIGEIPRRTMIRHLIILGMPFMNRSVMDHYLTKLGYLPLEEEHLTVTGEALDLLLIRLMFFYQEACAGADPQECMRWFQEGCRLLDSYFAGLKMRNFRFMYFKSLKE